ncbi:pantetheine-phosphate adenylyltransferase [Actinomyces sp. zg-332]|uniref:pantetheine-phosphate adenylyltransferase n=1 Tax=Actinomyces sp. zg-332 TaxID=2708340 RepID=UPI00141EEB8B|nr:pantetheine-phosphate adenylyltransferase [Actinomyces sp. zg-332]QPK94447.1 pantetheine-phosphate adenylyltransferase [Actinomyces sp. zg-332]
MVKALVVGSFDPFTLGHEQLVSSALKIADEVHIVVAENVAKKYVFPLNTRIKAIKSLYADENIIVTSYSGLVAQYCEENNIGIIVKGIRNSFDFEYEKNMAIMNEKMCGVETIFVTTKPHLQHISSTLVREMLAFEKDISEFVPSKTVKILLEETKKDESNYE